MFVTCSRKIPDLEATGIQSFANVHRQCVRLESMRSGSGNGDKPKRGEAVLQKLGATYDPLQCTGLTQLLRLQRSRACLGVSPNQR